MCIGLHRRRKNLWRSVSMQSHQTEIELLSLVRGKERAQRANFRQVSSSTLEICVDSFYASAVFQEKKEEACPNLKRVAIEGVWASQSCVITLILRIICCSYGVLFSSPSYPLCLWVSLSHTHSLSLSLSFTISLSHTHTLSLSLWLCADIDSCEGYDDICGQGSTCVDKPGWDYDCTCDIISDDRGNCKGKVEESKPLLLMV